MVDILAEFFKSADSDIKLLKLPMSNSHIRGFSNNWLQKKHKIGGRWQLALAVLFFSFTAIHRHHDDSTGDVLAQMIALCTLAAMFAVKMLSDSSSAIIILTKASNVKPFGVAIKEWEGSDFI